MTDATAPVEAPEASATESVAPEQPAAPKRAWAMPKSRVDRQQVDEFGRTAVKASTGAVVAVAKTIAGIARYAARMAGQIGHAIEKVPAALQLLVVVAVLMLLGIVGSIALAGTMSLICAVVVVPIASITLGALGNRWFNRHGGEPAAPARVGGPEAAAPDLARSVVYVDRKLTLALNSLGSERHQQAVIALFQAKTAVELALGTEQDEADREDAPVQVDAYRLRPRIQSGSKSAMSESNSLAAS